MTSVGEVRISQGMLRRFGGAPHSWPTRLVAQCKILRKWCYSRPAVSAIPGPPGSIGISRSMLCWGSHRMDHSLSTGPSPYPTISLVFCLLRLVHMDQVQCAGFWEPCFHTFAPHLYFGSPMYCYPSISSLAVVNSISVLVAVAWPAPFSASCPVALLGHRDVRTLESGCLVERLAQS